MTETRKITLDDAMLMGVALHKRGMLTEAENIYQDILRSEPEHADATHYLGVVSHQMGDSQAGIDYINRSLELAPDQPDALNNLGNINKEIGRLQDALDAYRKVLDREPEHADTWVNLAVILRELKRPEHALEHVEKALELNESHADGHFVLGDIYRDMGRYEDALKAYEKSSVLSPESQLLPKSIARLQYANGYKDEAVRTLKNWLHRRPDGAVAPHIMAAYQGENTPSRASDEYVRMCFDNFAKNFDECLNGLEYKAPTLICDRLNSHIGDSGETYKILDIGCGTGLCAPLLKPVSSSLTGVDLSPKMLNKARLTELYDELEEAELTEYMQRDGESFDVVVCADTFVYFGQLEDAFSAAHHVLRKGGWFLFTVEQQAREDHQKDFRLQPNGRYSHSRQYIESTMATAGFEIQDLDDVFLRQEGDEPVNGLLVAASKR